MLISRKLSLPITPALVALALAGCQLGPDYQRPKLDIPAGFRATPSSAAAAWPDAAWWRGFGSPVLDQLVADARARNDDLIAAIARVRQADAQVRIAGAPLLPSVTGNASGTYERIGTGGQSGGSGAGLGVSTGVLNTTTASSTTGAGITTGTSTSTGNTVVAVPGRGGYVDTREYRLNASVSYELDFWGRNLATAQAAEATALATRYDQQTVALTVITSVANTWFTALADADRLAAAEKNLSDTNQTLAVLRARLNAGIATALDIAQQETLVAQQQALIPNLRSNLQQQVIALGILTGVPPERLDLHPDTLFALHAPTIAPGLPSELLVRRPDVAYAEAQLVAQNANIRAARAAFFPSVQLTGLAGFESLALTSLFGPGTLLTSAGASITQTIFDNGLTRGQLEQTKGRYTELAADYHKAVLQAFTDVDTALVQVREATEQERLSRVAADAAQRASDIARAQLAAGTVDITTVLQSETALFNAQDTLAQARLLRFQAIVSLFKALGGGWVLPAHDQNEAS